MRFRHGVLRSFFRMSESLPSESFLNNTSSPFRPFAHIRLRCAEAPK